MSNLNIPIYRAKKKDSDEYAEGFYYFDKEHYIHGINTSWVEQEIDKSTLSIHFNDMIASDSNRLLQNGEKDLRIFASLSEDGKGGDILKRNPTGYKYKKGIVYFKDGCIQIDDISIKARFLKHDISKITGIQNEKMD